MWGLYLVQVAVAAESASAELRLGRPLTDEESGAIWQSTFDKYLAAQAKIDAADIERCAQTKKKNEEDARRLAGMIVGIVVIWGVTLATLATIF